MKVKFLKGLPGSGKSTWARKFCEKNPDWIRVSRDDLRNMRGKYWIPKQEDLISDWEKESIAAALRHNKNVIIDATNFNPKSVQSIKDYLVCFECEYETKFFDTPLEECITRDAIRANSVGEKVIRRFYNKYLKKDNTIKQDLTLPSAIICDLDGTLCIHNGRSPYDYDKCDTDLPNGPIVDIINKFGLCDHGWIDVIFLSGREDVCREKTIEWIKNTLNYEREYIEKHLFMRKAGDHRKDSIVKEEIFKNEILPNYYTEFILDDRNQVVEMWRDLGLTCLQVAEGDF